MNFRKDILFNLDKSANNRKAIFPYRRQNQKCVLLFLMLSLKHPKTVLEMTILSSITVRMKCMSNAMVFGSLGLSTKGPYTIMNFLSLLVSCIIGVGIVICVHHPLAQG